LSKMITPPFINSSRREKCNNRLLRPLLLLIATIILTLLSHKVSPVNSFATRSIIRTITSEVPLRNQYYHKNKYSLSTLLSSSKSTGAESKNSKSRSYSRSALHTIISRSVGSTILQANNVDENEKDDDGKDDDGDATSITLSSSFDFDAAGILGILASMIVIRSEFVLKTTGCGLPAGPYGLVGAIEGISYLGVVATAATAIATTVTINNDNNNNNYDIGVLRRLATLLSYSAIIVGIVVVAFQIFDYGYVPNAIPMDGGMCK